MLERIATWGKFESKEEVKKFAFLASIFCLIIGTYWALRPMKDGIFDIIVGVTSWQPTAKILSLFTVFPLVIAYSKLIDLYPRQKVFYILISIYALLALIFTFAFMHPDIGLLNTVKSPYRILGWLWYVYVESFGSLIIALFWAFTADTTSPDSARRGFPFVALCGQFGNILGPVVLDAKRLGFSTAAPVVGLCAVPMICTGILFWIMLKSVETTQWEGYQSEASHKKEQEPGFLEGLKLLLTQGYLFGIFLVVTTYEIIITFLDYHFKSTSAEYFAGRSLEYGSYLNTYAIMTGIVSTACVLLGINSIQKRLGMAASLLLLPILVAVAVVSVKMNPQAVTIAFWIMVFSKGVNYSLNQPTLKQLYIPTTEETKYKSQAWIEMFGSRLSKAGSSLINTTKKSYLAALGPVRGLNQFLWLTMAISLGMIGIWLFIALYVAKKYNKAINENSVVC